MDPVILAQSGDLFSVFQLHCGIPDPYAPLDGTPEQQARTPVQQKQPVRRTKPALSTTTLPDEAVEGEQEVNLKFDSPCGLPAEIWEHIFTFLPLQTLAVVAQTCRFFARLRWPLVVVDRLGPRLDDAGLRTIVSHHPKELRLAHCPRLGEHAAAILISCPTLHKLRLQGVPLTPAGVEHVARGFFAHYNRVSECVLRNCKLDDAAMAVIAEALGDTPTTPAPALTTLSLANNAFTAVGLGLLLDALGPTITSLNVSGNPLGGQGGAALGKFLQTNKTLRVLTAENVELGFDGLELISSALRLNTTLKELHLAENALDSRAMQGLARALEDNTTLEVLDIHANVIESEGCTCVARALRRNRTVRVLNLWDNRIGQNGARALAQMLEHNTTLEELNLRFNGFNHVGVTSLATALRTNHTLRSLDLSYCYVGDTGATALAQMLEVNDTLKELLLSDADIGNAGATRLGLGLTDNKTLERLVLSYNRITDAGAIGLAQGMLFNIGLHELLLQGSDKGMVGPDGARQLALALRRSTVTLLNLERNDLRPDHAALFAGLPAACTVHVVRQPHKQQVTWQKKKKHWLWKYF